jgi:hypothetical protein
MKTIAPALLATGLMSFAFLLSLFMILLIAAQ